ncbi:unnamed protein product [Gongylonema pulchrum]|uniref:RING-type domain-containing protein n=1 Tax=Gongylonema pulchrum TaxID=637853 RepID=A0A183EAC6_9BILA|nr:unnamed protein product [Gongylonema pulchrum]
MSRAPQARRTSGARKSDERGASQGARSIASGTTGQQAGSQPSSELRVRSRRPGGRDPSPRAPASAAAQAAIQSQSAATAQPQIQPLAHQFATVAHPRPQSLAPNQPQYPATAQPQPQPSVSGRPQSPAAARLQPQPLTPGQPQLPATAQPQPHPRQSQREDVAQSQVHDLSSGQPQIAGAAESQQQSEAPEQQLVDALFEQLTTALNMLETCIECLESAAQRSEFTPQRSQAATQTEPQLQPAAQHRPQAAPVKADSQPRIQATRTPPSTSRIPVSSGVRASPRTATSGTPRLSSCLSPPSAGKATGSSAGPQAAAGAATAARSSQRSSADSGFSARSRTSEITSPADRISRVSQSDAPQELPIICERLPPAAAGADVRRPQATYLHPEEWRKRVDARVELIGTVAEVAAEEGLLVPDVAEATAHQAKQRLTAVSDTAGHVATPSAFRPPPPKPPRRPEFISVSFESESEGQSLASSNVSGASARATASKSPATLRPPVLIPPPKPPRRPEQVAITIRSDTSAESSVQSTTYSTAVPSPTPEALATLEQQECREQAARKDRRALERPRDPLASTLSEVHAIEARAKQHEASASVVLPEVAREPQQYDPEMISANTEIRRLAHTSLTENLGPDYLANCTIVLARFESVWLLFSQCLS